MSDLIWTPPPVTAGSRAYAPLGALRELAAQADSVNECSARPIDASSSGVGRSMIGSQWPEV